MMPVAEFTPDLPAFQGGAGEALNVIPASRSYRPFPSFATFSTTPLSARAQGAFYCRDESTSHLAVQVAGDATKLYLLTLTVWGDATRLAGGPYITGSDYMWDFDQFGPLVIGVNGSDAPQKLSVASPVDTHFSALGGSPPVGARFICIMGDFVVLARMPTDSRLVQWSAINDGENYVASAVTQSDAQELPDGGDITGSIGYEYGGLIFQERAIRRMDYEGSPTIFRFKKVADGIGATIAGSIAGFGDMAFFWHRSGPYMVLGAAQIVPIGAEKVAKFFWEDPVEGVDQTFLSLVTAAVDPVNKIYGILYPAVGSGGVCNRILVFHWDTGRWSHARPGSLEMIYSGTSQQGVTLEDLDVYGSIEAVPFSLDSPVWAGFPTQLFGGFGVDHNLGYFNGSSLAAIIDTTEGQIINGKRAFLRSLRPMVEGSSVTPAVAIGTRNRLNDPVVFGTTVTINSLGYCKFRSNAMYHRARMLIPAADTWTHVLGVDDIEAVPAGNR